jgi:Ca2+-binding RTX toxin-like protein
MWSTVVRVPIRIFGGDGDDYIRGGAGADSQFGNSGVDHIDGNSDEDQDSSPGNTTGDSANLIDGLTGVFD